MDKLGSFVREETCTILTLPNLAYLTYSTLGFWHVNTYIEVVFNFWHFQWYASRACNIYLVSAHSDKDCRI